MYVFTCVFVLSLRVYVFVCIFLRVYKCMCVFDFVSVYMYRWCVVYFYLGEYVFLCVFIVSICWVTWGRFFGSFGFGEVVMFVFFLGFF